MEAVKEKTKEVSSQTVTNEDILVILEGLAGLGDLDVDDFKTNYAISRNTEKLAAANKAYQKSKDGIAKKFCKRDSKGSFVFEKQQTPRGEISMYTWEDAKQKESYEKAMQVLNEETLDVELFRLKTSELRKIKKLKPNYMAWCGKIIDDDDNALKED